MSEVENSKDNSSWGGARTGAGRPKGSENEQTKHKREVESAMKERILRSVDSLLNAQMTLAQGVQMLYCITTNKKGIRSKPELVTDQDTIERYLSGELEEEKDDSEYYFITTERPDNRALDSLFDRTFGKAKQPLVGGDEGDAPLVVNIIRKNGNNDPA